ncbi:MAG TPA: dihydrolipoyl dehydrogenase [Acidimicrobiales bacterium]|nr:dihydrolipoyl dehydrogenase [Acidimicrobiales bacterium]
MVPTAQEFDVVVIGGGPGGYATALYGANAGLNIAVVELEKVGGTCLHRGCIPAKEFLETASVLRTVAGAKEFGVLADQPAVDFAVSQARKQKVVDGLWKGLQGLMRSRKITTVLGTGALGADHLVRVDDGTELHGTSIVLAAGSVPRTIPGFNIDGRLVMTSDEVLALDKLPGRAVVIGGGAIGCEFASMLADLGTRVTLLEVLPRILMGVDEEVAAVVSRSMKQRGVDIQTGVAVRGHTPLASGEATTVQFGDDSSVEVDCVIVSVGRAPRTEGLLLEGTGVSLDERGFVPVDPYCRTSAAGVWAVGDVISTAHFQPHPQLAHVGFEEGMLVVKDILGETAVPVDYGKVPWCIYCHPEVAFVGMSEQQARDAGHDVIVKKMPYSHNGRALILGEPEGMVKVIAEKLPDGKAGKVLGVHMVGPWVTEQLGQAYLSVNWEATPTEIAQFTQPHPSLSEQFGEAVLALTGRGLHG